MLTKQSALKKIQDNIEDIEAYGIKRIGIFGSVARSNHSRGSDIDVLIEFQKGKKAFDSYMDLKFYLEGIFHAKVDLVIKDALKPRIRAHVLGEVLYA